jgi:hypothetical protein
MHNVVGLVRVKFLGRIGYDPCGIPFALRKNLAYGARTGIGMHRKQGWAIAPYQGGGCNVIRSLCRKDYKNRNRKAEAKPYYGYGTVRGVTLYFCSHRAS